MAVLVISMHPTIGAALFGPNVCNNVPVDLFNRATIGRYGLLFNFSTTILVLLRLQVAHRHVGRVERANAFEVMFRAMLVLSSSSC